MPANRFAGWPYHGDKQDDCNYDMPGRAHAFFQHCAGASDQRAGCQCRQLLGPFFALHGDRDFAGRGALNQFDDSKILAAAELLADAKVDVIGWSGTAAGWRGFETDMRLCQRITERTGIKATTAILALNELMEKLSVKKLAIVSPYTADVQQCIVNNYRAAGVATTAERHLDISVNHSFALVEPEQLLQLIGNVIEEGKPDAVVTYCTNLRAAQLAREVEQRWGVPLLDTVSTTVWGMLRAAGRDPSAVKGWGRLFDVA